MKKIILVLSFLFTSCIPDKINLERRGFIEGCVQGSKGFIQMTIRRELPYEQVKELRKICIKIYEDYKRS